MIAADTSAWLHLSRGVESSAASRLAQALASDVVVLPAPVLFEVLSGVSLTDEAAAEIRRLPLLDATDGYWIRAAAMRRKLLKRKVKARAMDTLIAQSCIDSSVALITGDEDFRHFVRFGLQLA